MQRRIRAGPGTAEAAEVAGHLRFICPDASIGHSGNDITGTCPEGRSTTPEGCACVCDAVSDGTRTYEVLAHDVTNRPQTVTLGNGSTATVPQPSDRPRTTVGTNPTVHIPTDASQGNLRFGAFRSSGAGFLYDNWRILAHELCGHGRLRQSYHPEPTGDRPGHDPTIDTENAIGAEHGGAMRGHHADPRQGESFVQVPGAADAAFKLRPNRLPVSVAPVWHFEPP